MTCTEFEELSGAYVLDAITAEEHEEAEAHLAQCTNCTHVMQELRPVADLLPLAVPQIEPPAQLKERILASIQGEVAHTTQTIQSISRSAISSPF
jgi:anti-sigma factor RsiW